MDSNKNGTSVTTVAQPGVPATAPPSYDDMSFSQAAPYPDQYGGSSGYQPSHYAPAGEPATVHKVRLPDSHQQQQQQLASMTSPQPVEQAIVINTAQGRQVLLLQPNGTYNLPQQTPPQRPQTFAWHIAMSCCVFWCCCWPFGLIAFILAMVAVKKSKSLYADKARRLGVWSLAMSIVGVVTGIIFIVTFIVIGSRPPTDHH